MKFQHILHSNVFCFFLWLSSTVLAMGIEECVDTPEIFPGTTLANLADRYFADLDYRFAILLATNSRSGSGFSFIGDPNQLPVGDKVCIPNLAEAERLRNRFLIYMEAVRDMALAETSEITDKLDPIDTSKPVTAVSWIRANAAKAYRMEIGETITADGDTWVSLAPMLQNFCRAFVADQGNNLDALTLRLEQRLGLPPHSAKTHFVELEVKTTNDPAQIFRPCASPEVTTTSCALGPPQPCTASSGNGAECHTLNDFFFHQYYTSYGVSLPTEYPWTSLGYTFDWSYGPIGLDGKSQFIQHGESEYVIPKGAEVLVKAVHSTAEYCQLDKTE